MEQLTMEKELENELKSILDGASSDLKKDMQKQNDEMLKLIEQDMYNENPDVTDNEHYLWKVVIHVEGDEDDGTWTARMAVEGIAFGGDIYEMLRDTDVQKQFANAHALIATVHARGLRRTAEGETGEREQCRVTLLVSNAGISAIARFESNPELVEDVGSADENSKLARALIGFYHLTTSVDR